MKTIGARSSFCCFEILFVATFRMSLVEVLTAENSKNSLLVSLATILARVVFPDPGGPQKTIDGKKPDWAREFVFLEALIKFLIIPLFPTRCLCPTNSDNFLGLSLSAKGV